MVTDPNGETSVTSTATIQPVSDGLVIRCRKSANLADTLFRRYTESDK